MLGDADKIEHDRAQVQAAKVKIDQERLQLKKTRAALECELSSRDLLLKNIDVKKAILPSCQELLQAGVARDDVDLMFPLPDFEV